MFDMVKDPLMFCDYYHCIHKSLILLLLKDKGFLQVRPALFTDAEQSLGMF